MKKYDTLLELLEDLDDDVVLVFVNENGKSYGYDGVDEIDSIDFYHPDKKVEKYEIKKLKRKRNKYLVNIWIY